MTTLKKIKKKQPSKMPFLIPFSIYCFIQFYDKIQNGWKIVYKVINAPKLRQKILKQFIYSKNFQTSIYVLQLANTLFPIKNNSYNDSFIALK